MPCGTGPVGVRPLTGVGAGTSSTGRTSTGPGAPRIGPAACGSERCATPTGAPGVGGKV